MSTADAVSRECAWLQTSGDGLPALLASATPSGPWQIIDPYTQAAATRTQQTAIYVTREPGFEVIRVANQRTKNRYRMKLEFRWPVRVTSPGTSTSIAAAEQQNLDNAIELVKLRVAGPQGDKSHGGRFLSAAVAASRGQPDITVTPDPAGADATIRADKGLRASMTYLIDDFEVSN